MLENIYHEEIVSGDIDIEKINLKIGLFQQKFDFTDTEKERKRVLDLVSWMIISKVKGLVTT